MNKVLNDHIIFIFFYKSKKLECQEEILNVGDDEDIILHC